MFFPKVFKTFCFIKYLSYIYIYMYVMYFTICAIIISYISVVTIGFCFLFRIKFGLGFTQVLIYTGRENSFDKSKKGGPP